MLNFNKILLLPAKFFAGMLPHRSQGMGIWRYKTNSIMKTQIDILSVTPKKDGTYVITYWDEATEVDNNVTMQISEDSLLNHVESKGWNEEEYYNANNGDIEVVIRNPSDYLSENRDEVIKSYIQSNS